MDAWNEGRKLVEKRQLMWYSVIGEMPTPEEDSNLHAIAHLYASDRNGLFTVSSLPLYASYALDNVHRFQTS